VRIEGGNRAVVRAIHPFPARMASDLALRKLASLPRSSVVLDPMSGSGTVVRQASELGHIAIGMDLDPLAILISRVWTTPIADTVLRETAAAAIRVADDLNDREIVLPWIDNDDETRTFVRYWFGGKQRSALRRLSYVLCGPHAQSYDGTAINALKVALSRIIVTKDQCASLARDTSHSRPHKVCNTSSFEVFPAFVRSVNAVATRLSETPPAGSVSITLGDARCLQKIKTGTVDAVLTSPPYLNAIDYLRGHKFSLVWFGHRISELRAIRSESIGAERCPVRGHDPKQLMGIKKAMGALNRLPPRIEGMVDRYVGDIYRMLEEISRVLKPGGEATFVVGNSCLRTVFIKNSEAITRAAEMVGLRETDRFERDLPAHNRYLPTADVGALGKRMRTETVLTFSA
jgi:hypothetical protein